MGKGSRTVYCIEARFRTADAQSISRDMQVTADEYHAYQPPQDIEMIYLPTTPTLCNRYPVPAHTCCANVCVMFMSPTLSLLGLIWNWWSGAHGTVLVIYLCLVSCWFATWMNGGFRKIGHGNVVASPSDGHTAAGGGRPVPAQQLARPGVRAFAQRLRGSATQSTNADQDSTVVVGEILDESAADMPDPENAIPVVEGHVVIPHPLGAPLLPRSFTVRRGRV